MSAPEFAPGTDWWRDVHLDLARAYGAEARHWIERGEPGFAYHNARTAASDAFRAYPALRGEA